MPSSIDIIPPLCSDISTSPKSSGKKAIESNNNNTNNSTEPVIEVYSPILKSSSASPRSNVLSTENVANLPNASIVISSPESAQVWSNNLISGNNVYTAATSTVNNNSNKSESGDTKCHSPSPVFEQPPTKIKPSATTTAAVTTTVAAAMTSVATWAAGTVFTAVAQ